MNPDVFKVAFLLFGSGLCALIYQTTWLRELRLIFGASTPASAAVLAIFMAGLGWGSAVLGKRADRKSLPLCYYGKLELLIALSAAASPGLVWLTRESYVACGGTQAVGLGLGTVIRLVLSAFVLGLPTFLMGGTLPAAVRAVESDEDRSRRRLAVLYGANTLGAVTGAALATFYLFENLGNQTTLWLACVLNSIVALTALVLGRRLPSKSETAARAVPEAEARPSGRGEYSATPPSFVLTAAAVVGFAFLLMEIVWYRMLTPLLGGSTFTFGLILAVALLGIGLGSMIYTLGAANRRVTLGAFAFTCGLEAVCLAYPFALGDDIAILTLLLRPLGLVHFYGHVVGWIVITAIVVLPAAMVAGYQFPLLIGLLGQGENKVGRHTGSAYAANTFGAIVGSLAGGFGLLPVLTAPGTWRLVIGLLAVVCLIAVVLSLRREAGAWLKLTSVSLGMVAMAMLLSRGPTAAWRHSQIGAGRVELSDLDTVNKMRDWIRTGRRAITWEAEGRESSVAVDKHAAYSFLVNGKVDGNARYDAGTQVVSGLVGAILHPKPTRVLVIGLGTGSTAGWLGAIPSVARVDVAELEPSIIHVAELCTAVNQNVLRNPKVNIIIGDGREVLLTAPQKYDLIISEPSNLYRAGVATLFTRDFYGAVAKKLNDGGIFVQWLQAYETDYQTLQTAYATLFSVFPFIETWRSLPRDLLFVSSVKGLAYDADWLRLRIREEPFGSGLANVWRVTNLEGFFARYLANDGFARAMASAPGVKLNTDDRTVLEYAFARSVGRSIEADPEALDEAAWDQRQERPARFTGSIDWQSVVEQRRSMLVLNEEKPRVPRLGYDQINRVRAFRRYLSEDFAAALSFWRRQSAEPRDLVELTMVAELLADAGNDDAFPYIEKLRACQPVEADALVGRLHFRQRRLAEAAKALKTAFIAYRQDPWPQLELMKRALSLAEKLAEENQDTLARQLYEALEAPFAVSCLESTRLWARLEIAKAIEHENYGKYTLEAIQAFEPHAPWEKEFLDLRAKCYARSKHPNTLPAQRELEMFMQNEVAPWATSPAKNEIDPGSAVPESDGDLKAQLSIP